MRIAICDDDMHALRAVKQQVEAYAGRQSEPIQIKAFASGKELWFDLEDRDIADLFILDIEMPEFDGISLAEIIRRQNPTAMILFYTAYAQYALQGYQVEAIRYILKGSDPSVLTEALDYALSRYQRITQQSILIARNHMSLRIPYAEILYAAHMQRQVRIYTLTMGEVATSLGLQELFDRLQDTRFFFIDRGTFVNLDYVSRVENNSLKLTTGETLFVSRRNLTELKVAIAREWRP